jgi:cell fate regulator YaaT (PSP1 superfamily)
MGPGAQYVPYEQTELAFQGEIEHDERSKTVSFYRVEFNRNRSAIFQAPQRLELRKDAYVLTEADRGFDIGRITEVIDRPTPRDVNMAKKIIREATLHEVQQLPQRSERETKALELCRAKAAEMNLPMNITGAEFQFDGKKLTFYYTADIYVDFRALVKTLFKIYGTRIWMVWYDPEGGRQPQYG